MTYELGNIPSSKEKGVLNKMGDLEVDKERADYLIFLWETDGAC